MEPINSIVLKHTVRAGGAIATAYKLDAAAAKGIIVDHIREAVTEALRESSPSPVTLPTSEWPLSWRHVSKHPELFEDGSQYLVAVAVRNNRIDEKKCYWEYSVITIHCDEGHFSVTLDGEYWGWKWSDVEWYIPMSEFKLPGTDIKPPAPVALPPAPEGMGR